MKEKITKLLNELCEGYDGYIGSDMMEDGILDSFIIMELIAELEEIYHIEIDADDIVAENFKTVDSILILVKKQMRINR